MKLDEAGHSALPYSGPEENDGMITYSFETSSDDHYEVYFSYWKMDPADAIELFSDDKIELGKEHIAELQAAADSGSFPTLESYTLTFALMDEDDEVQYGIMNMGSNVVFQVFDTVRNIVVDFLKRDDWDALEFSAAKKEKSRQRLYDHLARLLSKTLDLNLIQGFDYSGDKVYFLYDPTALEEL